MPELLESKAVAQILGLHRDTISSWTRAGRLHPIRLARRTIWHRRDPVLRLLNGQTDGGHEEK
jgi:predicted site-specific integrase-resolvase